MGQPPLGPFAGGWEQPTASSQFLWATPPAPGTTPGQWDEIGARNDPPLRARGSLIAAAVAAVALVSGGVATYAAVSEKNEHGAASPRDAIQSVIDDLNNSDLIGVLDDLAPGERDALVTPVRDQIDQLKRLRVFTTEADPSSVAGFEFQATDLTYAPDTITINDHVQIVQITGGTVTLGADLRGIPFTREFLDAAFPDGAPAGRRPEEVDLADVVEADDEPIRLAAQKVDGRWYPSIAYSIADNAAHDARLTPSAQDYIPPVGASSPEEAVQHAVIAVLSGDLTAAIRLASPDELAAVHDYGGLIVANGGYEAAPVTIKDLQLGSHAIPGGKRVTLQRVDFVDDDGHATSVVVQGSCFIATHDGNTRRFCPDSLVDSMLGPMMDSLGVADSRAERDAIAHLLAGLAGVGIDATEVGGSWYVNPTRSYFDAMNTLLGSLQGDDALTLADFVSELSYPFFDLGE